MSFMERLVTLMDTFTCRVCGVRVKPVPSSAALVCIECASFENIDLTNCLVLPRDEAVV